MYLEILYNISDGFWCDLYKYWFEQAVVSDHMVLWYMVISYNAI